MMSVERFLYTIYTGLCLAVELLWLSIPHLIRKFSTQKDTHWTPARARLMEVSTKYKIVLWKIHRLAEACNLPSSPYLTSERISIWTQVVKCHEFVCIMQTNIMSIKKVVVAPPFFLSTFINPSKHAMDVRRRLWTSTAGVFMVIQVVHWLPVINTGKIMVFLRAIGDSFS